MVLLLCLFFFLIKQASTCFVIIIAVIFLSVCYVPDTVLSMLYFISFHQQFPRVYTITLKVQAREMEA